MKEDIEIKQEAGPKSINEVSKKKKSPLLIIVIVILILAVGVALSTVYCRYHHALDSVVGILWGTAAFIIGQKILKRRN